MREKDLKETGLADMAFKVESDHEVQMARAELYKVAKYAIKMHEMLKGVEEREGLEGWVQSKITKAADYLGSVYHHMDYEMKFNEVTESRKLEEKEEMCPKACCGQPVTECTCGPDCKHCDCYSKNKATNESKGIEAMKKAGNAKADAEAKEKLDVTDADKRANTTAYKRMKAGDKRYNDKTTKKESYEDYLRAKLDEDLGKAINHLVAATGEITKSVAGGAVKGTAYGVGAALGAPKGIKKSFQKGKQAASREEVEMESVGSNCPDCGNPSYTTLPEEKQKGVDGKVCWKGYKRMGTKKKGGKTVDNCVKM